MKKTLWLAPALVLCFGACATEDAADAELGGDTLQVSEGLPPAAEPMQEEMGGMATTVSMSALNDSGVTGEAILTPTGTQTEVTVTLNGLEPSSTHPGHIHQGSCDAVGSVMVPLSEITADASGSGTMTATVELAADSILAGDHIVVYHADGGTPAVCGEVEG